MPVRTHGLTHLALAVRDLDRAFRFYERVFGVRETFRDATQIQTRGPGEHDLIAFERRDSGAGDSGGILHFGFRLVAPEDLDAAVDAAIGAGGRLIRRGHFAPGCPYAYLADPDGYTIEIWFE